MVHKPDGCPVENACRLVRYQSHTREVFVPAVVRYQSQKRLDILVLQGLFAQETVCKPLL